MWQPDSNDSSQANSRLATPTKVVFLQEPALFAFSGDFEPMSTFKASAVFSQSAGRGLGVSKPGASGGIDGVLEANAQLLLLGGVSESCASAGKMFVLSLFR